MTDHSTYACGLYELQTGFPQLRPVHPSIIVRQDGKAELIRVPTQGQIVGHYRFAAEVGWQRPILSGEFGADQSYLRGWIQQLKQVRRELA